MSKSVFRSPSWASAEAAATLSRLGSEVESRARWRRGPEGTLDVARLTKDGRIELFQVEDNGKVTQLPAPSAAKRRWAVPTLITGYVLFFGAGIALGILGDDAESACGAVALLGWFLVVVGLVGYGTARDVDRQLGRAFGKDVGWHETPRLGGWLPRSSPQLRAVQQIADEHDGVAYVQDIGARTVDVYAKDESRLEHYWIDETGRAELIEKATYGAAFAVDIALRFACMAFFIAAIAVGIAADDHKVMLILVAVVGCLATMLAAARVAHTMGVAGRLASLRQASPGWHEIRTWEVEADGG